MRNPIFLYYVHVNVIKGKGHRCSNSFPKSKLYQKEGKKFQEADEDGICIVHASYINKMKSKNRSRSSKGTTRAKRNRLSSQKVADKDCCCCCYFFCFYYCCCCGTRIKTREKNANVKWMRYVSILTIVYHKSKRRAINQSSAYAW